MSKQERDYLIQKKVPKDLQPKFDEWKKLRNLPFGKEARSQIGNVILDIILSETSFLDNELIKKLENLFIEGTHKEKLNLIVEQFLKWHERFPYLTVQTDITPQDAGFPPCPFVKAIYWEDKFLSLWAVVEILVMKGTRVSQVKAFINSFKWDYLIILCPHSGRFRAWHFSKSLFQAS